MDPLPDIYIHSKKLSNLRYAMNKLRHSRTMMRKFICVYPWKHKYIGMSDNLIEELYKRCYTLLSHPQHIDADVFVYGPRWMSEYIKNPKFDVQHYIQIIINNQDPILPVGFEFGGAIVKCIDYVDIPTIQKYINMYDGKIDWDKMFFNTYNDEKRLWIQKHIQRDYAFDNKEYYDYNLHHEIMTMHPLDLKRDYSKSLVYIDPKNEKAILWFIDNYGRSFLKHHVCIGNKICNIMISALHL